MNMLLFLLILATGAGSFVCYADERVMSTPTTLKSDYSFWEDKGIEFRAVGPDKSDRKWLVESKKSEEKKEEALKTDAPAPSSTEKASPIYEQLQGVYSLPALSNKRISLQTRPSAIQSIIELVGQSAGINFVIDADVTGQFGKLSFQDATAGQILDFLFTHNEPRLALLHSLGGWRVMRFEKAEELLRRHDKNTYKRIRIEHARMDDRFQKQVLDTWTKITSNSPDSFIIFDVDRKKIFVRGERFHVQKFKEFIREIDLSVLQVRIDAILVSVTKEFNCDLGFDWSGIYNRESTLKARNDNFGFAGLGARVDNWGTSTDGSGKRIFNPLDNTFELFTKGIALSGASFITLPFVFGGSDIDNRRLNIVLNAAEAENRLKILSRPSILTSNNEAAKVHLGSSIPIVNQTQNFTSGATSISSNVEYREVGITLEVLPMVNVDEGTVSLSIFIEDSAVTNQTVATEVVTAATPPIFSEVKAKTIVLLKSGETTVIGGLREHRREASYNSVPLLSKIPLVGKLFRASNDLKRDVERYFFITPTIVQR